MEIATTGCSRFIILIKRSDFPSVDDIPHKKEISENLHMAGCHGRFVTSDSTSPMVGSLAPARLFSPNLRLVALRPPQIPSPHYRLRLKKTSFMFYKAREPNGNERVPAWKTNKEKEGEKSTVEWGIHSSSLGATGPWLRGETHFWLMCVYHSCRGRVKLSGVNKRRCFFFSSLSNSVYL